MNITPEQHIENWKGLYDNAVVKLNEYKKSFTERQTELYNNNRELSMRILKVEDELEKYKFFFRQIQEANQTLIKKL